MARQPLARDRATQVAASQDDSSGFLLHLCGAAADAGPTCRLPRQDPMSAPVMSTQPARSAAWDQPSWSRGQILGHKVTGHVAANSSLMQLAPCSPVAVRLRNSEMGHAAHMPTEVLRPA